MSWLRSQYMHDEDYAIGFDVMNPSKSRFAGYGDKHLLDRLIYLPKAFASILPRSADEMIVLGRSRKFQRTFRLINLPNMGIKPAAPSNFCCIPPFRVKLKKSKSCVLGYISKAVERKRRITHKNDGFRLRRPCACATSKRGNIRLHWILLLARRNSTVGDNKIGSSPPCLNQSHAQIISAQWLAG